MASIKQLSINAASNAGVPLKLKTPDGEDAFITVRSRWSDAFVKAETLEQRKIPTKAMLMAMSEADKEQLAKDSANRMKAALVAGWSFDEDCTPENIVALFEDAPHIAEAVEAFASDAGKFYGS